MDGPFDYSETEKLEEEFDHIIREAKRDMVALECDFCRMFLRPRHFTKEGFVEHAGKLICEICF